MVPTTEFLLNGQKYYVTEKISLCDLISYFNYNNSLFVLEHNNFISNKASWKRTFISNHDRIEVVTIVGGG